MVDPYLMPRFVVFVASVMLLIVAAAFVLMRGRTTVDRSIFTEAAFPLWAAFLVVAGVTVFFATNRSEALFSWLQSALNLAFFAVLCLFFARDRNVMTALFKVITLTCLVLGMIGICQYGRVLTDHALTLESTYLVRGLSGHRNLFAQTLFLTAPFAATGAIVARGLWRVICGIAVVLALVLVTGLMVRSVWVATAVASLAVGVLLILETRESPLRRRIINRVFLLTAGGALVAVTVIAGSGLGGAVAFASQLQGLAHPGQGTAATRVFLWRNTLRMAADHPLLGVGPGNWVIVFPRYADGDVRLDGGWRPPIRPHNDVLGVLAETGVLGLSLYLAVYLTILWSAWRIYRSARRREDRVAAACMFFALVGYFAFSLFSFPKERVEHSMLLDTIFASVVVMRHSLKNPSKAVSQLAVTVIAGIAAVIVVVAGAVGARRAASEVHLLRARGYWEAGEYSHVVDEINRAYSPVSTVDQSAFPLLFYRGAAFVKLGCDDRAHDDFKRALRDSPVKVTVLNSLAISYAKRGQFSEAEDLWRQALEIHPGYRFAVSNLAGLLVRDGRDEEAMELLRGYDHGSADPQLNNLLLPLLRRMVNRLGSAIEDHRLVVVLRRRAESDDWLRARFQRSIQRNTRFEDEILEDLVMNSTSASTDDSDHFSFTGVILK